MQAVFKFDQMSDGWNGAVGCSLKQEQEKAHEAGWLSNNGIFVVEPIVCMIIETVKNH